MSSSNRPIPASWHDTATGKMFVMAPMVGQSDLPFRRLVRNHGATVVYSEMFMADAFATDSMYREQALGVGVRANDHPLVVQFAANDPEVFAAACFEVREHVPPTIKTQKGHKEVRLILRLWLQAEQLGADGVDLNLGCPQDRAKLGHYGAYLTDPCDWARCEALIAAAVARVRIPVTVKIRLQPTLDATIAFAVSCWGLFRGVQS
jgi:tRNA-dihydrouridine synthase 1